MVCYGILVLLSVFGTLWRVGCAAPVQLYKNDYIEEHLVPDSSIQEHGRATVGLQANPHQEKLSNIRLTDNIEHQAVPSSLDQGVKEIHVPLRPDKEEIYKDEQDEPVDAVSLIDYVVRRVQDELVDSFCGLTECSQFCGSDGRLVIEECLSCIVPIFRDMKPVLVIS